MTDWTERAACRGADPELFFPPSEGHGKLIEQAKAFCKRCPVMDECRADALRRDEKWGIWGGTTHTERQQIPEKTCTRCGETKPLADFYARPGRSGGFRSQCKPCENENVAASRDRRKAAMKQMKRCSRCQVTKAADMFDRNRSTSDGRASECKDCCTERYLQRRNEPREVATEACCTRCEVTKPAAGFSLDRSRSNGLTVWCKTCRNTVKRERIADRRRATSQAPKQCRKCEVTKPAGEFYRDATKADGLNSYCKTCNDRAMGAARDRREARKVTAA